MTSPPPLPARHDDLPRRTVRGRLRYAFDQTMSRGIGALLAWLALVSLALTVLVSVVLTITNTNVGHTTFFGKMVFAFLHLASAQSIKGDFGFSWSLILAMFLVGVIGLATLAALISIIGRDLRDRFHELSKGRSPVIESGHTLILGWSEAVFTIVRELVIANESRRKPVIVILADEPKDEMDDAIRERVRDLRNTKIVTRSGSPMNRGDLEIVNYRAARSTIVVAPEQARPDQHVVKVLLALTGRSREGGPIIAEVSDPANLQTVGLAGAGRAVLIDKRDTVAKLIVQTARESGAAVVYTELFDFGGDEIYFHHDETLSGQTFGEALHAFEDSCVIGLAHEDGYVDLGPDMSTRLNGHRLVVLADDDSSLAKLSRSSTAFDEGAIVAAAPVDGPAARTLLLGWNSRALTIAAELDAYASPGSTLTVVCPEELPELPALPALRMEVRQASTTDRPVLDSLAVESFTHIIVLSDEALDIEDADAETLVTLLHLRDLLSGVEPGSRPSLVTEIIDERNRELAEDAEVDDIVVSDKILSLIVTQIAENAALRPVFADLLDAEGSEIYLRPIEAYVTLDGPVAFATIVEAARRRGEIALGFRRRSLEHDESQAYGIRVNPSKSDSFAPELGDRVVVLAER
jgi:voltage-gated potassium channel Kch